MTAFFILLLASYLLGSIPTSIIMGKLLRGIDIREHGSGNAGGTNVFRVLGWRPALVVVSFDIFKGWLPAAVLATRLVSGEALAIDASLLQVLAGFAAVLGHSYTVFAGFRGGKGVGTLAGMLLALFPVAFPLCLVVFAATLIGTGYVSVSSMSAAASLPLFLLLLPLLTSMPATSLPLLLFGLAAPVFVVYTHRGNLARLRAGTENRFDKARIFHRKRRL